MREGKEMKEFNKSRDTIEHCRRMIEAMEVGEHMRLSGLVLSDIGGNWLTGETPLDRLMGRVMGSNFLYRTHSATDFSGDVIIERVEEDGRRWRADYDRRHLYTENPDGSLAYRE